MTTVLHRTAPWNANLHADRTRYAQVDDRRYAIENTGGVWFIWTVDEDGLTRNAAGEHDPTMFVALTFNLTHARLAVDLHATGKGEAQISEAIAAAPHHGTGRNHPRNVERRQRG